MDIAFAADKGGVGKTVLAYHVATRLKQLGYDVGLLDLDRRSASSAWLNAAEEPFLPAYALDSLEANLPAHEVRVWDTPAHPSAEMRRWLAAACDLVIVVAEGDLQSQLAAGELARELARLGCRGLRVLFNGLHPTGSEGPDSIASAERSGLPALNAYVRRYSCYQHAQWAGRAVCDAAYTSADKAWSDICAVTDELLALKEVHHAQDAA